MLDPDSIDGVVWHRGSASSIPLPDESVACIVTSPPYRVGLQYPNYSDDLPWPAYWAKVRKWSQEMARVLMPGGRLWLNVAPTVPLTPGEPGGDRVALAAGWMSELARHLAYRDTVVWRQAPDGNCAWGSYRMPSAPNLRGRHEVILSFYRPPWKRPYPSQSFRSTRKRKGYVDPDFWRRDGQELGDKERYDPEVHDCELGGPWVELVTNVWDMRQTTGRDRYPGEFPVELPARAIRLSTWPNDLVLDPFAGSGTTGDACLKLTEPRRCLLVDLPEN
jgi:DNA modification methylase